MLRVLFMHRDADAIDNCLQELKKGHFTVTSDFVLNLPQCVEQLKSHTYDVLLVEFPNPSCKAPEAILLLHQLALQIPLILLTPRFGIESLVKLGDLECFEYVAHEHLAHISLAVRRALNDRKLRDELDDARRALQHSQSLYRALVDNPAYGIYQCDADGELLDANQALVTMLGYDSKEQLLEANRASAIIPNLRKNASFTAGSGERQLIEPVEVEWKRKDGTSLKVRLGGRGAFDENGNSAHYEIIAVDITEQRTLEDHLRHQADCDSLTGLANHRRLFEVLQAEICRSKRTGREFSLLLLDLDELKKINDQFGHLAGDRALCRLGQILNDCCRSIDTAARHGGDEFALVLPETGWAAATLVASRICDLLGKDAEEPALSVSVGVASFPKDAGTIGTLLYAADKSLYQMKAAQPRVSRATNSA
ncbi:MAG TPA: diguanylate cyclase [Candidatus Baltobacteraceae bacterium]|nr:diguanylate cyclase [Candidatus Baltobacteraceae bacterium]